ncbi:MAG TPA: homoserine dehydrogenase, partial [Candidatus Nitrosocosmicus sp.]|nr:homoserine dehydrogenase [Candidatus Nitrosocosmicus sp.]
MRIIICGMGVVGQSFLKLLISSSTSLYKEYGIKPRVVACVDSKGIAYSPTGLDLEKVLATKENFGSLKPFSGPKLPSENYIEDLDAEVF